MNLINCLLCIGRTKIFKLDRILYIIFNSFNETLSFLFQEYKKKYIRVEHSIIIY